MFEQAEKKGALRLGWKTIGITVPKLTEPLRKPPSQQVLLRISTGDVDRARRQAAGNGIGYQTYIQMLLRAALDRQERVRRRSWRTLVVQGRQRRLWFDKFKLLV